MIRWCKLEIIFFKDVTLIDMLYTFKHILHVIKYVFLIIWLNKMKSFTYSIAKIQAYKDTSQTFYKSIFSLKGKDWHKCK
jgi:hypothetical protein